MKYVTSSVLVASVVLAAGCVWPRPRVELPASPERFTCRALVDGQSRRLDAAVEWHEPADPASRQAVSLACGTVGPAVYVPAVASLAEEPQLSGRLVLASWNVHVGGGDLEGFVAKLRSGALTNGEPVNDFVLMVQEAFRRGPDVPERWPDAAGVPDRISEHPPRGHRTDVIAAARALGLSVFYVPSMRNGAETGEDAEDRGNAILSTRPLSEFTGIELPYMRQRRVAVSAVIGGTGSAGRAWKLRVVSAHLNASSGPKYFWMLSSAVRERQARHLANVLGGDDTWTVMGSDLNTWAGGPHEPAYLELADAFPQTTAPVSATFGAFVLDYVFFRIPAEWQRQSWAVRDRFGSDHRPLVSAVEF